MYDVPTSTQRHTHIPTPTRNDLHRHHVVSIQACRIGGANRQQSNQTKPKQCDMADPGTCEHVSATGKLATVNSRAYVYVPAAAPFVQRFWRRFSWFSVARHRAVSLFLYLYVEAFIHAIRAAFLENLGNAKCGMRNVECVCALCVRVSPLLFRIHLHLYV